MYNAIWLLVSVLQSLLQSRAKSFLSAVYNEGFLYDSLLASQPFMPHSLSPIWEDQGMGIFKRRK